MSSEEKQAAEAPRRTVNGDAYMAAYSSQLELYQRLGERQKGWVEAFNQRHGIRVV